MATSRPELVKYKIHGMDCAEEVRALKVAFQSVLAAEELVFDVLEGTMEVPSTVEPSTVEEVVKSVGMEAAAFHGAEPTLTWWQSKGRRLLTIISGVGLAVGFLSHGVLAGFSEALGSEGLDSGGRFFEHVPVFTAITYSLGIAAGLWLVLPKAWHATRSLRPDMNLLMVLAVGGALALGEWFEAATVTFLFALSMLLESWSVERARRAVSRLLALAPPQIRIRRDEAIDLVDPASVPVGTAFLVHPGERIALDGQVIGGASEVDQSPITGESVPVAKELGSEVYAGTINGNGALEVRSTREAKDTTLAKIVDLVGEARKNRSEAERWVERFSRIYTPIVFAAAVAVTIVPPVVFAADFHEWLYRGLVLLVIGCPCALVIATPVAVVAGLASAARHGVLIKGGGHLETPSILRVVALDKTGTLTEGRPKVSEVISLDEHGTDHLLRVAAAIEQRSTHPVAAAIVERASNDALSVEDAQDVEVLPGKGVQGVVDNELWWLGSHRYLEERDQETPALHDLLEKKTREGRTAVVIGTDDHVCGLILLEDQIREDAHEAIVALHRLGLKVAMLTGDNRGTAESVAGRLGIDYVRSELLPEDKVRQVEQLERDVGAVAMIGDGVNDAPALARAHLGIAMGVMGTDVAVETADIALMADDLSKMSWLVGHSRRTKGVIRQNTSFALGVKALFVALTFAGLASLWGAIAADMGASLLVIVNALRLLKDPMHAEIGGDAP